VDFAIVAGCYEVRLARVNTWRHDRPEWDSEEIRADGRVYLPYLVSLGYKPSPIEQAIIDNTPYGQAPAQPEDTVDSDDSTGQDGDEPEPAAEDDQDDADAEQSDDESELTAEDEAPTR